MVVASILLLAPRAPCPRHRTGGAAAGGGRVHVDGPSRFPRVGAGAATTLADRRLVALSTLMAMTIGTLGALNVLIVIVAIDVLGYDEQAAGYLAAVTGVGALLGSLVATSLVGRERIAAPLLAAVVGFAVAVAAVGLGSTPAPVAIALVATGIGWSVAWVAATTMIQRLVGDDVMTRVFGINESLQTGAESLGGTRPSRSWSSRSDRAAP